MDRLAALDIFVQVVDSGSFSAVARRDALGQPAVSKAVNPLEERLGVSLLLRSTRRGGAGRHRPRRRVRWSFTPDWALPPIKLSAVFPTGRLASTKTRAFVTFVEQCMAQ